MTLLLLFVLVLTHRQTQLVTVQANYSVALPLSVRSPSFSCWLPQVLVNMLNSSTSIHSEYHLGTSTSYLSPAHVRVFSPFDAPELRYSPLF